LIPNVLLEFDRLLKMFCVQMGQSTAQTVAGLELNITVAEIFLAAETV